MPEALQELLGEIVREHPAASIEYDPLPSGVCLLDVWLSGRMFTLDYNPSRGVGVSENKDNTPPFIGHDEVFESLDDAIIRFKELLATASRTETTETLILHDKKI